MEVLKVNQLTVNYGKTPVLWDVSLTIPTGKIVGIIGPNGAGKTTFIRTALGLIQPISGNVQFFEQPLKNVQQRVAYVPQRGSVDWDFPVTVRDVVTMGRYGRLGLFHRPKKQDHKVVDHYLDQVGMLPYASRQISQLSGGQQQRVFIARALVQEADVYFMDEPFAGVDIATEKVIMDLLHRLKEDHKTVFVVHHDLNSVESYFDWVILLNMRLVAYGEISETFTAENLNTTYGKNYALFGEALKLSRDKSQGLIRTRES